MFVGSKRKLRELGGRIYDIDGRTVHSHVQGGWQSGGQIRFATPEERGAMATATSMISGGEAYAYPAYVWGLNGADAIASFFKIFKGAGDPSVDRIRYQRARVLANADLRRHPMPVFKAAPYAWLEGAFEGQDVSGHLSPEAAGQSLESIRENHSLRPEERVNLAEQLAYFVRVIESAKLAHADLAPQNLFVSADYRTLTALDYDGFFHPDVRPLPYGVRTIGSDGYRHPAMQLDDEMAVLKSDRFAMAVLIVEIVALELADYSKLGRSTLFDQERLSSGDFALPEELELYRRVPVLASLLDQALRSPSPEQGPSPEQWLAALQNKEAPAIISRPTVPQGQPLLVVRDGPDGLLESAHVGHEKGSLEGLHSALEWLAYENTDRLTLTGVVPADTSAYLKRGGRYPAHWRGGDRLTCELLVDDRLIWSGYVLERLASGLASGLASEIGA